MFWVLLLTATRLLKHFLSSNNAASLLLRRFVCVYMFNCLHPSQPVCEQACLCAYVSIFACLLLGVCMCVWFKTCDGVCVFSCVTQFRSSLSFLPGPVLVIRAPPEGPLARWERCWRRPGPAVLLPSPSTGCQAQRVPLSCQAWRRGCLHSRRRVWTGQGAATSCRTHTCRKAPARTHRRAHCRGEADSRWVRHMFGRCRGGERKRVDQFNWVSLAVCAGEKHQTELDLDW